MTSLSKPINRESFVPRTLAPPPIPLARPTPSELKKGSYVAVTLRSVPTDDNSQTYELNIGIFRSGSPEQFLEFRRDLLKAIAGQNITTGPSKFAMARRLLAGDALSVFNAAATAQQAETNATFVEALKELCQHVFPQRALRMQKRYMRRYMRKPSSMKTREYIARVNEINGYLKLFPPFEQDQSLPDDEVLDLLEFAVPQTWQKQFWLQGFDPLEHTIREFTEFCERLEFTEDLYDTAHRGTKRTRSGHDPRGMEKRHSQVKRPANSNHKQPSKWCEYHKTGSHSTGECKIMLAQAQKMRAAWDNRSERTKPNNVVKNNKKSQEDINAIIGKAVKEAIHAERRPKKPEPKPSDEQLDDFELLNLSETESEN